MSAEKVLAAAQEFARATGIKIEHAFEVIENEIRKLISNGDAADAAIKDHAATAPVESNPPCAVEESKTGETVTVAETTTVLEAGEHVEESAEENADDEGAEDNDKKEDSVSDEPTEENTKPNTASE